MRAEYDDYADVYEQTIEDSPIARQNLPFYVRAFLRSSGPSVELGIGTGRIAVEVAARGKAVIGVDNSSRMLAACRKRAADAGVSHLIHLVQADFRDFELEQPATLIAMPFHTICDIADASARRAVLRHVHSRLASGGLFMLDYFVFDADLAARYDNIPHMEAEYADETTGHDVLFWTCGMYNFEEQTIDVVAWSDEIDSDGVMIARRYRRYKSCWIEGDQMRAELTEAGFDIAAVYGDFRGGEVDEGSTVHVWVARKP